MKKAALQLTELDEWKNLVKHYNQIKIQKFKNYSLFLLLQQNDLAVEVFCKNGNSVTQELLLALYNKSNLGEEKEILISSAANNQLRYRQLLHCFEHQLPSSSHPILVNFAKMSTMVNTIRDGKWYGGTGKTIKNVVFITGDEFDVSIRMLTYSLKSFNTSKINFKFLVNADSGNINTTLNKLNPESTLFILCANSLDDNELNNYIKHTQLWLKGITDITKHYIAITETNHQLPSHLLLDEENRLSLMKGYSSRFSSWSPMSLPFAISVGMEQYHQFIQGGSAMDQHFLDAPVAVNIPVQLALFDMWYINVCKFQTRAVTPYAKSLNLLLEYLETFYMPKHQLNIDRKGRNVGYQVSSTIWGCVGSKKDTELKQFLSSFCNNVPCDFIFIKQRSKNSANNSEFDNSEFDNSEFDNSEHRFSYNKLELEKLTPYCLGSLMALYEHRLFSQSILWSTNPFSEVIFPRFSRQ